MCRIRVALARRDSNDLWVPALVDDSSGAGWGWFSPPRVIMPTSVVDPMHPSALTLSDDDLLTTITALASIQPKWDSERPAPGAISRVCQTLAGKTPKVGGVGLLESWRAGTNLALTLTSYDWGREALFAEGWTALVTAHCSPDEACSNNAGAAIVAIFQDSKYAG